MDTKQFLRQIVDAPGVSGMEDVVCKKVEQAFINYCDTTSIDAHMNVYGNMSEGSSGKKIMLAAHMDEIGLITYGIDDKGFVSFQPVGGVDPRILPGQEVIIHGTEDLYGIIGAKPPHLQKSDERNKAPKIEDMTIDLGLSEGAVKQKVRIGDPITFIAPFIELKNDMVTSNAMDDRAGVALLYETMKELSTLKFDADVCFVATVQEEVGVRGAIMSGYTNDPDLAIAIDVTFGYCEGCSKDETFPLDGSPTIGIGPLLNDDLNKLIIKTADKYGIKYHREILPGRTGTDADALTIARHGIPTLCVSLPLTNMHTTVETLNFKTIENTAKLLARFIAAIGREDE